MIELRAHDPQWTETFESLRRLYLEAFEAAGVPVVAVEHVGSTSVPGLAAKPVIDIDVVVRREDIDGASQVMESLGFEPRGEMGIPDRWAFGAPEHLSRAHTYVVIEGSLALRNHLAVRDVLRADPALRAEYESVKRTLARTAGDMDEYVVGKSDVLQRILAAAGITDAERAEIGSQQLP